MGQKQSKNLGWDEDKRAYVEEYLKTNSNPRILRFKDYKFPIEDPIKIEVRCNELKTIIKLKNYKYPAGEDVEF